MSTRTLHPRQLGHGFNPFGWAIVIVAALLVGLVGLALFRAARQPVAEPEAAAPPAVAAADPAQAGVMGYVAAHEAALAAVAAADPAQAGVMGYVAAHEAALAAPAVAADPAQAGVMGYLRAHGARP